MLRSSLQKFRNNNLHFFSTTTTTSSDSTLRRNVLTGNWTVFASGRTNRPKQTASSTKSCQGDHPSHLATCPFCVGNEDKTPPELLRVSNDTGGWSLRVIPNAFPAVQKPNQSWKNKWESGEKEFFNSTINEEREAIGFHEVVVETPVHNLVLATQSKEYFMRILNAWRERGQKLYESEPSLESILYFKNNGSVAGASLIHPHSQIVGLPLVGRDAAGRNMHHLSYFERHGRSVWDVAIEEEFKTRDTFPDNHRIVDENELFISFVPFAAISPFHVYIVGKSDGAHFEETSDKHIDQLAEMLRSALKRQHVVLGEPDYNLILRSSPLRGRGTQAAFDADRYTRWHLVLTPRLGAGAMAGFELGSGMFSNGNRPEQDAHDLRMANI
jgi:UDPglucose--hexose-1-phosphate uridylyltransferase